MAKDVFYVELAKAKIQDRRNAVISACSKGGFTIAQQLQADEPGRITGVFLKGALHVDGVCELQNLRDALDEAIKISSKQEENDDNVEWDE